MSARHIYHTALPLSPETSVLRLRFFKAHSSWAEDWTPQQASSSKIPATWGPILRTIIADSGGFTHVTVAGQRIIALCGDYTVNVYDGVTGVLRMSLNAPKQVTRVGGSPDGSLLFFVHPRAYEITVWDTQTGGWIHTFATSVGISDIAVSLKGKYLTDRSPDYTDFRFWEVESRRENLHCLGEVVSYICWLEPEDQVALALKRAVVILDVATGRTLRTINIRGGVKRIAFCAGQRQLAIGTADKISITGIQTGPVSTSSPLMGLTWFAFSSNGDRIICATDTGDLRHLNISTHPFGWSDNLIRLGTIDSVDLLQSGHLVTKVGGSIQLLEKEYTRLPSTSVDSRITRVYQLDDGKAICVSFGDHRDINLLDMETMRDLVHHHSTPGERDTSFEPRFVCASIEHRIAVLRFLKSTRFGLSLHTIGHVDCRWKKEFSEPVLLGAVSPDGEKFVIVTRSQYRSGAGNWKFYALNTSDGEILASFSTPSVQTGRLPRNIAFTSEPQFYTMTEDRQVFPARPPNEDEGDSENNRDQATLTTSTTSKRPPLHPYIRKTFSLRAVGPRLEIKEMPGEEILPALPYALDDSLEWVVDAKSRRVCWLPPGHTSGTEDGHFFVGSSIVMGGQDGIVRRLTFRNPSSDS
jgi:WD40 repeat protein